MKFPTQNIQDVNFIVYRKIMILSNGKNLGKTCAIFWAKLDQFMAQKNAHGKIHGLKKRILEYILSRYFIVIKYLQDEYRIYKNCIFSRLFKKFWWENYGANYGQNRTNLCDIFCPWCFFTLKVSERFQFTLPYREWQEYSHKIKISATQLVFVFLPYKRILAHKRAFFNKNLKPSHLEFYKFNADSVIQHLCIKFSCVVNILKKIA